MSFNFLFPLKPRPLYGEAGQEEKGGEVVIVIEKVDNKIRVSFDEPEEREAIELFFKALLKTDKIRFRLPDGYFLDLESMDRERIHKLLRALNKNSNSSELVVEVDE